MGSHRVAVLARFVFLAYLAPLYDLLAKHDVHYESYADDTQIYRSFKPSEQNEELCMKTIEESIQDIRAWMTANWLKLNDDKTEVLYIGSSRQLAKCNKKNIKIGDNNIRCSDTARNLGVIFDSELKFKDHVKKVCRTGFFHLSFFHSY